MKLSEKATYKPAEKKDHQQQQQLTVFAFITNMNHHIRPALEKKKILYSS